MNHDEQWKPIAGFEGLYEVSDMGRVRSLGRVVMQGARAMKIRPRIRKQSIGIGHGYPIVSLFKNGRGVLRTVHRMVAVAFIPNPLGLSDVDHRDRVRTNATAVNLRWVTRSVNNYNRNPVLSGPPSGVRFKPENTKRPWIARLSRKYLGCFTTLEAATAARAQALEQFIATQST